jgi:ADP-heptose:LPS heptosyltransferase
MNKEFLYKKLFNLSSIVTDYFPEAGARVLNYVVRNILGNKILLKLFTLQAEQRINSVKTFSQILVVADLNIGDSIIGLSSISALRKIFPHAEIDYVIKKSAACLIEGNPEISNLFPVFLGAPYPEEDDLALLEQLIQAKEYDIIINLCPMISGKIFGKKKVVDYSILAGELIRNEKDKNSINNISFQAYNFIINLFHDYLSPAFPDHFEGPSIYLSVNAVEKAEKFLLDHGVSGKTPLVMFNPDATSKFTRIPFDTQVILLKRLAELKYTILLGESRFEKNIEQKLKQFLQPEAKSNIFIIPAGFNLDEYTALIDFSNIFITGDTGPLHLAAARKFLRNSGKKLRNRTAVFSIFGGTPPKIYGFDSKVSGFFAANQDALSRVFIGKSPCRNITCINKAAKTCREVRCFNDLDMDEIIFEAAGYLTSVHKQHSAEKIGIIKQI